MRPLTKDKLDALTVGTKLIRALSSAHIKQEVIVTKIYGAIIHVETLPEKDQETQEVIRKAADFLNMPIDPDAKIERPAWTFSINTAGEIDIDCGWDGISTGSFLTEIG